MCDEVKEEEGMSKEELLNSLQELREKPSIMMSIDKSTSTNSHVFTCQITGDTLEQAYEYLKKVYDYVTEKKPIHK